MVLSPVKEKKEPEYPKGPGMVEYGVILGLISLVSIAALTATGGQVNNFLGQVKSVPYYRVGLEEKHLPPTFKPWVPSKKKKAETVQTWMGPKRPK